MRISVDYFIDNGGSGKQSLTVENVDPKSDTIKVVKLKIGLVAAEKRVQTVPPLEQRQLMLGEKILSEKGHQALSDHGIVDEESLGSKSLRLEHRLLVIRRRIFRSQCPTQTRIIARFHVDPKRETVDSLKTKIQGEAMKQDYPELGSIENQMLFHGEDLLDGCRKLSEYNIQNDSTLHFYTGIMQILVRDLKDEYITYVVEPSDTIDRVKTMILERDEIPVEMQRLLFAGRQLEDDRTLSDYNIDELSTLTLLLRVSGNIGTFTSINMSDPLIAYLMHTDQERASCPVPMEALCAKAESEGADLFSTFRFQKDCKILHPSQRNLLCRLLNFVWQAKSAAAGSASSSSLNANRVDMRLSMTDEQFLAVVGSLDIFFEEEDCKSTTVLAKLQRAFLQVPGANNNKPHDQEEGCQIVLRMTHVGQDEVYGTPCIGFHCDDESSTTSVSQIPLNEEQEYKGGKLVFFVNNQIHVVPRTPGSLVQHPPRVLHGVSSVMYGTRQSLFVIDKTNGLGGDDDEGIVKLSSEHVVSFLASKTTEANKKQKTGNELK